MPSVSYISNGFCKEPAADDPRRGMSELRIFNPMPWETTVRMTVYYADKGPAQIPEFTIRPEGNPLMLFPKDHPELFSNCGPGGMRIVSDTTLIIDHILIAGRQGPPENLRFSGGVSDSLAKQRLSRLWYFADGLALVWQADSAPWPFNEFEWYHVLDPTARDAHVTMKCYYPDRTRQTYEYTVPAERVRLIDNCQMVKTNNAFGIRFASDGPIVVESERFIYGLHSMEEWGAHIHCPRPGVPAPLEWNEEDVVR
ncbi:MAG: hypothetical protein AMJ81_08425 [Phycisphaerae bacterium SM23_33]|nr:MAG: hypothetical protein AMJ81_08425 [Phycisphaerae bacterium SM23_33]